MPSTVATAICTIAPGRAMRRTDEQVVEREVQADAEHQQDHADLGELLRRAPTSATKPGVNGPMTMPATR